MTAIGSAAAADRWRTGLLLTLLVAQTVIVWEQVPETWRVVAAWLGDAQAEGLDAADLLQAGHEQLQLAGRGPPGPPC